MMRARRLAYVCAALTPIWLLALLGILGRFYSAPWQSPEYGLDIAMDIRAYKEPIVAARQAVEQQNHDTSVATEAAADLWIAQCAAGTLKPIPPACGDDDGTSGVRQEIDNAKKILMQSLARHAIRAEKDGDLETAERLYMKGLEVGQVAKYMSSLSIATSSSLQIISLDGLERIASQKQSLDRATKNAVLDVTAEPEAVTRLLSKHARTSLISASNDSMKLDPAVSPQQILDDLKVQAASIDGASDQMSAQQALILQSYRVAFELENRVADRRRALLRLN